MKNLIILLYLCCCCHILVAQDYFSRTYDPFNHRPELLSSLELVNDQLWISAIGPCIGTRCLEQLVLDKQGHLIHADTLLRGFDPGLFPVYTDSTLTTSGLDYPDLSKYMLYQSTLDGDSLGLIDLQIPGDRYHEYFNKGMIEYNDQYVAYGQVTDREDLWEGQEKVKGLLFWVNKDLTLDTITFIEPPEDWLLLHEAQIDPQNQLTFIYQYTKRHPISQLNLDYKALIKLNEERQVVFNWESTSSDNTQSNLAILDDGTMITDFNGFIGNEEILAIAPDGELKWTYIFDTQPGIVTHGVIDLGIAANGDIIGCGLIRSVYYDYGLSGFIFRFSPQGELLWKRIFLVEPDTDPDLPENWPLLSQLFQIIELPNGDLVAGGEVLRPYNDPVQGPRRDQDVWVIRTDAEGCMQEDCGFEQL
ncbi:MAG: hypothetical protein AAGG75_27435, partial [Bacteroidota bacterium]